MGDVHSLAVASIVFLLKIHSSQIPWKHFSFSCSNYLATFSLMSPNCDYCYQSRPRSADHENNNLLDLRTQSLKEHVRTRKGVKDRWASDQVFPDIPFLLFSLVETLEIQRYICQSQIRLVHYLVPHFAPYFVSYLVRHHFLALFVTLFLLPFLTVPLPYHFRLERQQRDYERIDSKEHTAREQSKVNKEPGRQ